MDTVVVENEHGAVLRYPEGFRGSLVQSPHDVAARIHHAVGGTTSEVASLDGAVKTGRKIRRKRARRTVPNKGEVLQMEYHSQIKDDLMRRFRSLIAVAKKVEYFPVLQPKCLEEKGLGVDLQSLCDLDALVPVENQPEPLWIKRDSDSNVDAFGRVIYNPADSSTIITTCGRKFLIPSHSSFLLSDISKVHLLLATRKYSLIVIDPPWENRSAIRGKKYRWLSSDQLLGLPIPDLAAMGALVVVWVTNKRKLAHFVKEVLFPSWQVVCIGEWHWIKVTTDGDLVFEMDSTHKKPYETLIIGRFHGRSFHSHVLHHKASSRSSEHQSQLCCSATHILSESILTKSTHNQKLLDNTELSDSCVTMEELRSSATVKRQSSTISDSDLDTPQAKRCQVLRFDTASNASHEMQDCNKPDNGVGVISSGIPIPYHNVIVGVPSNIHSQKPYLGDVLLKYLPKEKYCLELFARNLLSGWTSWGNEVLKFQEIRH